jgi:hypothetical protein
MSQRSAAGIYTMFVLFPWPLVAWRLSAFSSIDLSLPVNGSISNLGFLPLLCNFDAYFQVAPLPLGLQIF